VQHRSLADGIVSLRFRFDELMETQSVE
jgi:hypothetical protein